MACIEPALSPMIVYIATAVLSKSCLTKRTVGLKAPDTVVLATIGRDSNA